MTLRFKLLRLPGNIEEFLKAEKKKGTKEIEMGAAFEYDFSAPTGTTNLYAYAEGAKFFIELTTFTNILMGKEEVKRAASEVLKKVKKWSEKARERGFTVKYSWSEEVLIELEKYL